MERQPRVADPSEEERVLRGLVMVMLMVLLVVVKVKIVVVVVDLGDWRWKKWWR